MALLDPRRSENVGASELAALFSAEWLDETVAPDEIDPFESRYALWMRKKGRLPDVERPSRDFTGTRPALRDRKRWGNIREQGIALAISEYTGEPIQPGRFTPHPRVRGMSATLDYLIGLGDFQASLEIKNVDRLVFRRWPERIEKGVWWWCDGEWREAEIQPPFKFKLQCQGQMACTELQSSRIAPLVGGNELFLYRIDRHEGVIARIEREVELFWDSIANDIAPAPNWQVDVATVCALWGSADPGTTIDLRGDPQATLLARSYRDAQQAEKAAATVKQGFKAQLLDRVQDAERALFDEWMSLWAGNVAGGHREYDVDPYRGFLLTEKKKGKR